MNKIFIFSFITFVSTYQTNTFPFPLHSPSELHGKCTLAKEISSTLFRHIGKPNIKDTPCGHLWLTYKSKLAADGFLSANADKLWVDFMTCLANEREKSSLEIDQRAEKNAEAIRKFKEQNKLIK